MHVNARTEPRQPIPVCSRSAWMASDTPRLPIPRRRSGEGGTIDAAEADVAHAGVDHLGAPRGGAVAQAVLVGAEVGPALDDPARDAELRLRRVVALLERPSGRVARSAARCLGGGRGARRVP